MKIYVDADACPVKSEVVRVAERHKLATIFVANSWMRLPEGALVERIVVEEGADAADDWIASNIGAGDIAITADIPLASRCLKAGAKALGPTGKPFSDANIGMALAMRDLMSDLRESGEVKGYNAAFSKQDRSTFLQALEQAVQDIKRGR
ncbi:MAG: YaiI/YqxD family protein [Pseudomonadota bacterium]